MERDDWTGLGTSLVVHALLILAFALLTAGRPEPQPLGFVQVQLGPFAEGRPVHQAEEEQPEEEPEVEAEEPSTAEATDTETQPEKQQQPAPKSKPVELPDQPQPVEDEEQVETPEAETIAPEAPTASEAETAAEPQPERNAAGTGGGGATEGNTGAASGDAGEGTEAQASSPYAIEGLNRQPITSPLPRFVDKENVTLQFQIVVNPSGRILAARPVLKGNPALEREVQRVLRSWRFNPLPPDAPQVNQQGVITFRFRVR